VASARQPARPLAAVTLLLAGTDLASWPLGRWNLSNVHIALARKYRPNHLICHLDSELVVKQLRGEYRVKMPTLQPLVNQILELAEEFPDVSFRNIPREDNREADKLVNEALDGR